MARPKTSRVIKDYEVKDFYGFHFTVKAGAVVSNKTAVGYDDDYRFIGGNPSGQIVSHQNWWEGDEIPLALKLDIEGHGLNVPAEYCKPYEEETDAKQYT